LNLKIKKTLSNIYSILIIIVYGAFLHPKIMIAKNLTKINVDLKNYTFYPLLKSDSTEFIINKKDNSIIDFMFIDCAPCIEKLPYLQEVSKNRPVHVIVNGSIDKFEYFKEFYNKEYNGKYEPNLVYDVEGRFTKQFNIKSYPTELIINDGKIVGKEIGVPTYGKESYLNLRK